MEPIHQAAWDGDLAAVQRLVEEDGRRLNAPIRPLAPPLPPQHQQQHGDNYEEMGQEQGQGLMLDGWDATGRTPLMLAAYRGHAAVVARLLALGADAGLRDTAHSCTALHWACRQNQAAVLQRLLLHVPPSDRGPILNARADQGGWTPLIMAASRRAIDCVRVLLATEGMVVEVDARGEVDGATALYWAVHDRNLEMVALLLGAGGADPTIPHRYGQTPLRLARAQRDGACSALIEAAIAEANRVRALVKARALVDAVGGVGVGVARARRQDAAETGGDREMQQAKAASLAAAPAYLKGRVVAASAGGEGSQVVLPGMEVVKVDGSDDDTKLVACVKYALGLAYGGGWHVEGEGPPPVGMVKEVFVELMEMMVPKWARRSV